jgi:ribosomal protein S17
MTRNNASAPGGARPKRVLVGRVTSAKMQKTVVVEVVRSVKHPVYGKYVRRRKKYKAHDETQQYARATWSRSVSTSRCRATSAGR